MAASTSLHVVLGAGPLGLHVARLLRERGEPVRLVSRSGRAPAAPPGAEVIAADVSNPSEARRACEGAKVVYLCAVPPYHRWPQEWPGLMDGAIAGAEAAGARLVFGDNLYSYGHVSGPLTEDLPAAATGRKGRTRAAVSAKLLAAHRAGRVRAAIGRASDFFGPGAPVSAAMGERVFGHALKGKAASVLGNPDMPHTFTFIEDFARALIVLGERDEALGKVWHVPSLPPMTVREFVTEVYAQAGATPRVSPAPKLLIKAIGIFVPAFREFEEIMPHWEEPYVVDDSRFRRTFGVEPTPPKEAIARTLAWFRTRRVS